MDLAIMLQFVLQMSEMVDMETDQLIYALKYLIRRNNSLSREGCKRTKVIFVLR